MSEEKLEYMGRELDFSKDVYGKTIEYYQNYFKGPTETTLIETVVIEPGDATRYEFMFIKDRIGRVSVTQWRDSFTICVGGIGGITYKVHDFDFELPNLHTCKVAAHLTNLIFGF